MIEARLIEPTAPPGEVVLWSGRPSHRFFIPTYIIGVVLLAAGGVGVFLIGLVMLRQWTYRFAITTKRVTARTGIIGRHRRELLLADVRAAEFQQNVFTRLLGIGTVRVATAATARVELRLFGVRRPASVLAILRRQIDKARRTDRDAAQGD